MGADLIVSILVGPVKLKPSKALRKKILAQATLTVDAARHLAEIQPEDAPLGFPAKYEAAMKKAEKELLNSEVESEEWADISRLDVVEVLNGFLALWEYGARDANFRPVTLGGKKYQILVAGEMSWGDAPEGDGYLTIRNADRLGMIDALGIK